MAGRYACQGGDPFFLHEPNEPKALGDWLAAGTLTSPGKHTGSVANVEGRSRWGGYSQVTDNGGKAAVRYVAPQGFQAP